MNLLFFYEISRGSRLLNVGYLWNGSEPVLPQIALGMNPVFALKTSLLFQ
jgi:hypothetical protein